MSDENIYEENMSDENQVAQVSSDCLNMSDENIKESMKENFKENIKENGKENIKESMNENFKETLKKTC